MIPPLIMFIKQNPQLGIKLGQKLAVFLQPFAHHVKPVYCRRRFPLQYINFRLNRPLPLPKRIKFIATPAIAAMAHIPSQLIIMPPKLPPMLRAHKLPPLRRPHSRRGLKKADDKQLPSGQFFDNFLLYFRIAHCYAPVTVLNSYFPVSSVAPVANPVTELSG